MGELLTDEDVREAERHERQDHQWGAEPCDCGACHRYRAAHAHVAPVPYAGGLSAFALEVLGPDLF